LRTALDHGLDQFGLHGDLLLDLEILILGGGELKLVVAEIGVETQSFVLGDGYETRHGRKRAKERRDVRRKDVARWVAKDRKRFEKVLLKNINDGDAIELEITQKKMSRKKGNARDVNEQRPRKRRMWNLRAKQIERRQMGFARTKATTNVRG
jgi:hypothetical protein